MLTPNYTPPLPRPFAIFLVTCTVSCLVFSGTWLRPAEIPDQVKSDWESLQLDFDSDTRTLKCLISNRVEGNLVYSEREVAYLIKNGMVVDEQDSVRLSDGEGWQQGEVALRNEQGEYGLIKSNPDSTWSLGYAAPITEGKQLDVNAVKIMLNAPIRIAGFTILDLMGAEDVQVRKWETLPAGTRQIEIFLPNDVGGIGRGTYKIQLDPSNRHRLISWEVTDGEHVSRGKADYAPEMLYPKKYRVQYGIQSGRPDFEATIETVEFHDDNIPDSRFSLEHYGLADVAFAKRDLPWGIYVLCVAAGSVLLYFCVRRR